MAETPKPPASSSSSATSSSASVSNQPAPSAPSGGPKIGDIVLVRQDIRTLIPAIVTNDFEGQNAGGVVSVVTFSANSYGSGPVTAIANCQPETKDTTAEDLQTIWQGYYLGVGDKAGRDRDLAKEIEDHRKAQTTQVGDKGAT